VSNRASAISLSLARVSAAGHDLSAAVVVRLFGALAVLLLSVAPTYRTHSTGGSDFNTTFAVCGALLALVWLLYHVGGIRRRCAQHQAVDPMVLRAATFKNWRALMLCASIFAALWLLRAPIRLSALFAIATILASVSLLGRLGVLSLVLAIRDHSRPLTALRWLALVPCSLAGLTVGLETAGDSWATLLLGCVASGLGPLFAGYSRKQRAGGCGWPP
jgi:hypothetical protein